jgi:hypothetical protein
MPVRKFIIILFLSCFYTNAFAQKSNITEYHVPRAYYVCYEGSDLNPGTKQKPFRTINRLNRIGLIQSDTIFFKGNETFYGSLKLNLQGNEKDHVFISSYGRGRARIAGRNAEAMILSGSYFILKNIIAYGSGRKNGNRTHGILFINASDAEVRNCTVSGFQKSGIEIYKSANVILKGILAEYNGAIGISVTESRSCHIIDSKANDNPGDPTNLTNHSGNGILVGLSDSVIIDHCTATNNGWDMPRKGNGPVGIWTYESNHVIIQYCISYRNKTSKGSSDGGGFDLDGGVKNSIIQYCLSYENQGSGYGLFQYSGASNWNNNAVRFCISINDGKVTKDAAGILVWNNSNDSSQLSNCSVYNNLVFNNAVPVISFMPESKNAAFDFYNNIFIGPKDIINGPSSGEHFEANVWWSSLKNKPLSFKGYNNLTAWINASGLVNGFADTLSRQTDPLIRNPDKLSIIDPHKLALLNNFRLNSKSPVIDKGIKIKEQQYIPFPGHDFFGAALIGRMLLSPGVDQSK